MFTQIYILLLLMTIMIHIPTHICADLNWFGFRTADAGTAGSEGPITITLWYNLTIYSCTVEPRSVDTTYGCSSTEWTLLGISECSSPKYKMMIANPSSTDAVHIISLIIQDITDTWWSSDSWCIPDSDTGKGYTDAAGSSYWKLNDLTCPLFGAVHGHWNILCVDNEGKDTPGGCWPQEQIVSFDITRTNKITNAVTWENGAGVSVDPETCNPTISPTKPPTISPTIYTNNPTYSPSQPSSAPSIPPTSTTISPTNIPTLVPTNVPTLPSISPTYMPSMMPTNMPTSEPTHCTQDSNAIWKVSFDFVLNKDTSTEIIVDNLYDIATVFITTDIASSTVCNVSTYTISIGLDDNDVEHARINASICFHCADGMVLNINITQQQLQLYFVETVNNENTVLSVHVINDITVDILQNIMTTTMNDIWTSMNTIGDSNGIINRTWIGSMNFTESILLFIGLALLLIFIILFLIYVLKRKMKKIQELNRKNLEMTSMNTDLDKKNETDKNGKSEKFDMKAEKQENLQGEDSDDDLYSHNGVNVETKTKDIIDNDNDSDSDTDDLFSTEHGTTVGTV